MRETLERFRVSWIGVLRHAADLVERGWAKGNMALDGRGDAIDPLDSRACAFCAHGALVAAVAELCPNISPSNLPEEVEAITEAIIEIGLIGNGGKLVGKYGSNSVIHQWNDGPYRIQLDVVETLRTAADKIEAGAL